MAGPSTARTIVGQPKRAGTANASAPAAGIFPSRDHDRSRHTGYQYGLGYTELFRVDAEHANSKHGGIDHRRIATRAFGGHRP